MGPMRRLWSLSTYPCENMTLQMLSGLPCSRAFVLSPLFVFVVRSNARWLNLTAERVHRTCLPLGLYDWLDEVELPTPYTSINYSIPAITNKT